MKKYLPNEWMLVAAGVLLSIGIHAFFIIEGFGEQDSAQIANYALLNHSLSASTLDQVALHMYLPRVSPLYLAVVRQSLALGLAPEQLPVFMNWMSLIFGSLCLAPLYFLGKHLMDSNVAAAGCLMCMFMPAFWIANIYGMPTIVACFWFFLSLALFLSGSMKPRNRRFHFVAAGFFAGLALFFKADVILCYGAFWGILVLRQCHRKTLYGIAVLIPIVSFGAVVLLGSSGIADQESVMEFASHWTQRFPFTPKVLTDKNHLFIFPYALGWGFGMVAAVAGLTFFRFPKALSMYTFLLVTAVPTYLFWGLIYGNSARHLMVANVFIVFFLARFLFHIGKTPKITSVLVLLCVVSNYFSSSANSWTVNPSSRLFESSRLLQSRVRQYHEYGRQFHALPYPNKVAACRYINPYICWESISQTTLIDYWKQGNDACFHIIRRDGTEEKICFTQEDPKQFGLVEGRYFWTCFK